MKIRGERECKDCGNRWSYYESSSVVCPACGSIRSVGLDDPTEHNDSAESLDLSEVRSLVDEASLSDIAAETRSRCREYVRKRGFIVAGELRPLDDTYLAAGELAHAAGEIERAMRVDDDEEYYFLALLRGADDGERPPADEVPDSMRAARGLAYATAVDEYRRDVRRYLDDNPDRTAGELATRLGDQQKRIEALDGDVSPRTAGALVYVARALGRALADGDETALAEAQQRLDEFDVEL